MTNNSLALWSHLPWAKFFPSLPPKAKAFLFAGGAVTGWATWPLLAVYANPMPPLLILGVGATVGFLLTLILSTRKPHFFTTFRSSWRGVTVVTLGVVLNDFFYLTAISRIGAAEANIIHYLWPIYFCLFVAMLLRKMLTSFQLLGVFLSFGGAALAVGPQFDQGLDLYGLGFGLLGGLTFAIYSTVRTFSRDATDVVGPAMGFIAVVSLVAHGLLEDPAIPNLQQFAAIAAIGIVPLTLSTRLWDRATQMGQTSAIAAIAYLNPIIAIVLLAFFGISGVTISTLAAAMLIVAGALLASRA